MVEADPARELLEENDRLRQEILELRRRLADTRTDVDYWRHAAGIAANERDEWAAHAEALRVHWKGARMAAQIMDEAIREVLFAASPWGTDSYRVKKEAVEGLREATRRVHR